MKRLLFALAALAACSPAPPSPSTATTQKPPAVLTIGPDGAAGISTAIPMTLEAVAAAAPGFYVAEREERVGGAIQHVFVLSNDDSDIFRLYPTRDGLKLHEIVATSNTARGPIGEAIGVSTYYQAPHAEAAFCVSRLIGEAAGFGCSESAAGRFGRVYKLPNGYDGPSDPFDAIDPDAATDATLVEFRWVAP